MVTLEMKKRMEIAGVDSSIVLDKSTPSHLRLLQSLWMFWIWFEMKKNIYLKFGNLCIRGVPG